MAKSIKATSKQLVAIGLDLADVNSDWAGLDDEGVVRTRDRVKTTAADLQRVFGVLPPTTIAIEVGTHSAWVKRLLESFGHKVIVANARRVALIHRNKRKNNRIDAEFLARLVRVDTALLFPIKHRSEESQSDLAVLRSRDIMVRSRTKLINHVRGLSKGHGVRLPKCSAEAFVVKTTKHVPAVLGRAVNAIVEQIAEMTKQIRAYDREIRTMIKRHSDASQLMQITGVGEITALAYVLTIEDPHRIVRSRSAGAYFGLVPGSDDSGETYQPRRITKEGDKFCRRLLVSAAQYITGRYGRDSDLRRHGAAIASRGGKNAKKRAVVAVARKLAVVMHHLWISGETYVALFNAPPQTAAA
ncbi:MAG TPA: IS110 family transposase [Thermoanaerobaculia bacterium]|nr:IS110 family transposase [Thermoanaerobaculia bacterium]